MIIKHRGIIIELLADHAVHLPEHSALVLSDAHFGKAATFRSHGLPVPDGDDGRDLERIDRLLETTGAKLLIVVGDLTHSPRGSSPVLDRWLDENGDRVILVVGNHDCPGVLDASDRWVDRFTLGGVHFVHDPEDAPPGIFSICGHLHPAVRIKDGPRGSLRMPCFHLAEDRLTLPAFGSFTGGQVIAPEAGDRVYVPLNGRVIDATGLC